MNPIAKSNIRHVVVLLLENRSFDHLLGDFRRINPDCDGADPGRTNTLERDGELRVYQQQASTRFLSYSDSGFDPHHEFVDVSLQLGSLANPRMDGFAASAANSLPGADGKVASTLTADQREELIQSVMSYFPLGDSDSADSLPALHALARNFTVCDRWFASVPGPTWPNRFFAMMGSCHGRVKMPDSAENIVTAVTDIAAQLGQETIFSLLDDDQQIYSDYDFPLSTLLNGASALHSLEDFRQDAAANRLRKFSWIEPNYSSDLSLATSQHPPEHILRGDQLIANVYNALRGSDAWANSLFVVLYDEHGGFYDHVAPPPAIKPDADRADVDFAFDRLGVRVPAALASPWLKAGIARNADGTKPIFDHTSLLAFVCDLFDLGAKKVNLGARTAQAAHFGDADIWLATPRDGSQTPAFLPSALPPADAAETASVTLDRQLQGLLSGLDAHARNQLLSEAEQSQDAAQRVILDAFHLGIQSCDEAAAAL